MEHGQRRVLGANRSAADAVSSVERTDEVKKRILRICSGFKEDYSLKDLETALCYFSNHNSSYTSVETGDFQLLLEEVLNNSIRSVLIYADFSSFFGDEEVCSLSMAFQYNLSVEALTLSGINVSDECISALCESLVRSRVNFIDLSNTPLEDEAGRSLAALARVNPYLRTVVVDDTLITGDLLDEIDIACQYNQSNYEASGNALDESLLKEADVGRLKQRLQHIIRSRQRKTNYCVLHLFGICPYGDTCICSHMLGGSGVDEQGESLSEKMTRLFSSGGAWEERLLQPPQDGAAWRSKDNPSEQTEVKVDLGRRHEIKKRLEEEKLAKRRSRRANAAGASARGGPPSSSASPPLYLVVSVVVGVAAASALVSFAFYLRRRS